VTAVEVTQVDVAGLAFAGHHGLRVPRVGDRLEIDTARDAGSFGAIHAVAALDGAAPPRPILAKVFDPDATTRDDAATLADLLGMLHAALETHGGPDWPAGVLALPYGLLRAQVDGRPRLVALMLDLAALGYAAPPFADRAAVPAYMRRPRRDRIELARCLADRFDALSDLGFLHADLNPDNLMFNMTTLDAQVIDFDAGTVVITGTERPRTAGRPDDCMPPEVKRGGHAPVDLDAYTPAAERWAHGSLIGYCLFGVHPGFFLSRISRSAIEEYAAQPLRWPEIDTAGPLFTDVAANRRAYGRMVDELRELPLGTRDLFAELFRAGLDGAARPAPSEWRDTLAGLQRPPAIEDLRVDQELVLEGDDVAITWSVPNAAFVELKPGGRQPAEGRIVLTATRTMRVELHAFNDHGSDWRRGPLVTVVPLPRLTHVPLPDFPGLRIAASVPLVPAPSAALERSPARRPPRFASSGLIDRHVRATGPDEGFLPTPPPFTDLLVPLAPEHRPARARRRQR
jgi:hypothetical protein